MEIQLNPTDIATSHFSKRDSLLKTHHHFSRIEVFTKTGSFTWVLSEDFLHCSHNFFRISGIYPIPKDLRLNKFDFFNLIEINSQNFVIDVMHECIVSNEEFEITFDLAGNHSRKIRLFGYPHGEIDSKVFVGTIQDISEYIDSRKSLLVGQDSERKRISLEIHDGVGQKLIAAKYKLGLMKMTQKMEGIDELNHTMNTVIEEIRSITHNLSLQMVTELGLRKSIKQLLEETAKALNASSQYEYDVSNNEGLELRIDDDVALMIYRIIQECLSNALKHSQATKIEISIKNINNQIRIYVVDNGIGLPSTTNTNGGIGLQNIRERVTYLNGFLRINSGKIEGVKVIIKIPLKNATV